MQDITKIPDSMAGNRLDKVLTTLYPDYSRARLQQWIRDGSILINGLSLLPKNKVKGGETVEINVQIEEAVAWKAQILPLTILYEDEDLIVVNKPAGLVVHPGTGNQDNTLVNALLHHAPELSQLPRAGIIHRIDKETSGVLVIARSLTTHNSLTKQLQQHEFTREYQAITIGTLIAGGTIDAPIGRHPRHRIRMAVVEIEKGKSAVTHYRIIQRYRAHTHIRVNLETGRTHQIRVHMAYKRYPLVGDPVYGGRLKIPPNSTENFKECLRKFPRQALHAIRLGLHHPKKDEWMEWTTDLPNDMQELLAELEKDKQANA
jgi:23S rRNA pseudouridine1911/1915/1917 synthase